MPGIEYRFHGTPPKICRTWTLTKPAGPYIMIQPKPRISDEMKNGHCMAIANRRPPGSLVRTTTIAIGMAISRVRTVVSAANSKVFQDDPAEAGVGEEARV